MAKKQPDKDETQTEQDEVEETPQEKKSLTQVAQESLEGRWGVGQQRRLKLAEAGYDVHEVEAEVVRIRNEPLTRRDTNAEEPEGKVRGADDRLSTGTRATGSGATTAGEGGSRWVTKESGEADVEDRGSSD